MPIARPCTKGIGTARLPMIQAQTMKIASQQSGSMADGMTKTVRMPMTSPKIESCRTSFQFMVASGGEVSAGTTIRHAGMGAKSGRRRQGDASQFVELREFAVDVRIAAV